MSLTVSVVVPTFNRRERLKRLLVALERMHLQGARFEVIVVVDGATDGTPEMLAELTTSYPRRVLTQANQGPAAARNAAMHAASGDVLLFLDDDVIPWDGLIEQHLQHHLLDPGAVVIGPMIAPPEIDLPAWLWWEAATVQKQYDAMLAGVYAPTPRQFYTGNASVRRAHALLVGGFDVSFTRAEDVEFAFRLQNACGVRFTFDPKAGVFHEPDRTFASWVRVPYEYGRHDVRMARECGLSWILGLAYTEFRGRHLLNQLVPRVVVGQPWAVRLVTRLFGTLIQVRSAVVPRRLKRALCSALFTIHYWQGIADAMDLGSAVWRGVRAEPATAIPAAIAVGGARTP